MYTLFTKKKGDILMSVRININPSEMTKAQLELAIEVCTKELADRERKQKYMKKKTEVANLMNALLKEYAKIRAEELDSTNAESFCYCQEECVEKFYGDYARPVFGFAIDCDGDLVVVTDKDSMDEISSEQG